MNFTRIALTVGLAWLAARLLLKRRRAEPIDIDDGLAPLPSVDPELPVRVRALTAPAEQVIGAGSGALDFARGA